MHIIRTRPLVILSFVVFILSLIVRFQIHWYVNGDLTLLQKWYDHLYINGAAGLADENFSNYTPAYLYLLWASTLLSSWVGRVAAIKLIPTLFDILSAFVIFRMARLRFDDDTPYFTASGFFILPTILFNSTGWGQIESLYTSFLLVCVYLLLTENPFWAMAAFGVAFSFKFQSVFLLPFLGILFLKGKIRWYHFCLAPTIYITLGIPAALIGRNWSSMLTIYLEQVGQFLKLSMNAPNFYIFAPESFYEIGVVVGMVIFFIAMTIWGWINWRAQVQIENGQNKL